MRERLPPLVSTGVALSACAESAGRRLPLTTQAAVAQPNHQHGASVIAFEESVKWTKRDYQPPAPKPRRPGSSIIEGSHCFASTSTSAVQPGATCSLFSFTCCTIQGA